MRSRTAGTVAAVLTAGALVAGSAAGASTTPANQRHTANQAAKPAAWRVQAKLDAVATALHAEGTGAYADSFSNLYVDAVHDAVVLYATSANGAARMVAAAKKLDPGIDTVIVRYVHANFTWRAIRAGMSKIFASNKPSSASGVTIYSAAEAPDGDGILVTAKPSAVSALRARTARVAVRGSAAAIPVTVSSGSPISAASWRWDDTRPFIGGDVVLGYLTSTLETQCTTGLAAEDSGGNDYIITAAHCFAGGNYAYGEGDPTGDFGFTFGNKFGQVVDQVDQYDSEVIKTGYTNGSGSNSDEAEQPAGKWYPVPNYIFAATGASVCQDGARWYYTYGGVNCGITVTNDNVVYSESWDDGTTHTVYGEEVKKSGDPWIPGDSGGLVFTICGSNCRDAAGQVSALLKSNNAYGFFVTANDILSKYAFRLNPHT